MIVLPHAQGHRDSVISLDTIMKYPFISTAFMTKEQIAQMRSALDQYDQALAAFNPKNFANAEFASFYQEWLSLGRTVLYQKSETKRKKQRFSPYIQK